MWLISAGRYRLARVTFCADLSLLSLVAGAAAVVGAGPIDGLLAPSCFWARALPATDVTMRAARPTFAMFFIRIPLVGKAVHRSHSARIGHLQVLRTRPKLQVPNGGHRPASTLSACGDACFFVGKLRTARPGNHRAKPSASSSSHAPSHRTHWHAFKKTRLLDPLRSRRGGTNSCADRHEPPVRLVCDITTSSGEGQQRLACAVRDSQCDVLPTFIGQRVDLIHVADASREMTSDVS